MVWTPAGSIWSFAALPDLGAGGAAFAINNAGQIVGSVTNTSGSGTARPAFWDVGGSVRVLQSDLGVGETLGISEPDQGLLLAGYIRTGNNGGPKIAVRWQP